MTELQQLEAMLKRSGIGFGLRDDNNPPGTAVRVECDDSDDARQWSIVEFFFAPDGKLQTASCYDPDEG